MNQEKTIKSRLDTRLEEPVSNICTALLSSMAGLESAFRQMHPPLMHSIVQALLPFQSRLADARQAFLNHHAADVQPDVTGPVLQAAELTDAALVRLIKNSDPSLFIQDVIAAMNRHARAQETLYPLHPVLRPVSRYFLEKAVRDRPDDYAVAHPRADTGLQDFGDGYQLYVPEYYTPEIQLPLVVALHGGSGSGRQFIWTWLREARSRGFILMAPKAAERTWSFQEPTDALGIFNAVRRIRESYSMAHDKCLLTGFSDGAIYTLTCGLMDDSPFTHLAPVSGVFHPQNLQNATDMPIYQVHGTLDWMFPISLARQANDLLRTCGARIVYREIADLSHTYPREENALILEWFDQQ